jgi:hypothetical protein
VDVQKQLDKWRTEIKTRDFPGTLYAPSMILKDETAALLASVGPITSLNHLKKTLADQWLWIDDYGESLYQFLSSLSIPPMKPLPKKPRAPKHGRGEIAEGPSGMAAVGDVGDGRPQTRRRVNDSAQPPITAAGTAGSLHAGSSNSAFPTRRKTQKTPEEIRAEFSQLPVDPKLASLFTRSI